LKNEVDCFVCFARQRFSVPGCPNWLFLLFSLLPLIFLVFESLKKMFDFFGVIAYICSL
jgi:hypothetical protein